MNQRANTLAIIPARGGSKSIPRKNVRLIAGKPLIGWTIEAARAARSVDRVVVSTDDPEIAAVSRQFGADVVWRPPEISGDTASSESALLHCLEHLQKSEAYEPELVVFLQCTSPLTAAEDIDGTVAALTEQNADTALSVMPFHYFVWQNTPGDGASGINHDKRVRLRRQDRESQYLETGAVYVMKAAGFREVKHRFFGKTAVHVMPPERVLEIDEPVDFTVAGVLLRERGRLAVAQMLPQKIGAIVFDFDGVFTDNKVIVFQDGREAVACSRGDGMGFSLLRKLNIPTLVLSMEENPVVAARCRKLKLQFTQGCSDKLPALRTWLGAQGIDPADVIYVGNDVNDLECLAAVGCGVAVGDAHPAAKTAAKVVLGEPGGNGAIRELVDIILERMQRHGTTR